MDHFKNFGLLKNLRDVQKEHEKAVKRLHRKMNPPDKTPKILRDGEVKVLVVYSGKGGVGKTTTTANLAREFLGAGKRVAIIDGDVNTPSMAVIFKTQVENLLVCSMGYEPAAFVQTSKVRDFFRRAVTQIVKFKPEYVLVDTPPSITDVHLGLLDTLKPSGLILVTQPTELSWEDVSRTVWLFEGRKVPILGVVRSMVTSKSPATITTYPILANVKFDRSFSGDAVYEKNRKEYAKIVKAVEQVETVVLENRKKVLFDESPIDVEAEIKKKGFQLKFINLSSWPLIRDALIDRQDKVWDEVANRYEPSPFRSIVHDRFLDECTPDRVRRLVEAFQYDDEAYFMVTKAPVVNIRLIPGEIGRARLRQHSGYYNIPVIDYHTSEGSVTLFPYECMPVNDDHIRDNTAHGGVLLTDGRYLPGYETARELYECYGRRIGMGDDWSKHYAHWTRSEEIVETDTQGEAVSH